MSKTIRLIAAILLVCISALGLAMVFGFMGEEQFVKNLGTAVAACGIIFLAAIGFGLLGGSPTGKGTEPPPQL